MSPEITLIECDFDAFYRHDPPAVMAALDNAAVMTAAR